MKDAGMVLEMRALCRPGGEQGRRRRLSAEKAKPNTSRYHQCGSYERELWTKEPFLTGNF